MSPRRWRGIVCGTPETLTHATIAGHRLRRRTTAGNAARQPRPPPTSLFGSRTFTGWEGNLAHFRIEDGAIVGGTMAAAIARNDLLCTTSEFTDFELRLKVELLSGDKANAGVPFRRARASR